MKTKNANSLCKKIILTGVGIWLSLLFLWGMIGVVLPIVLGHPVFTPFRHFPPDSSDLKYSDDYIIRSEHPATSKKIAKLFPDDGSWVTGLHPTEEELIKAFDDAGIKYEIDDILGICPVDGSYFDTKLISFNAFNASIKQTSNGLKEGDSVKKMHKIYDQLDMPVVKNYPEKNYSKYLYQTASIEDWYVYVEVWIVGNDVSGKVMNIILSSSKLPKSFWETD